MAAKELILEVYARDGKPTGKKITLPGSIFGIEPNMHAVYEAVTTALSNRRQGTHKTKTYGEVAGSGKKLWKQKHTGRARVGAIRSPLWKGGGTIFGPVPRDYSKKLPRGVRQLARKSAFSQKATAGEIRIVEDFSMNEPRTREMAAILKALELTGRKTLLLTPARDEGVVRAGRNIPTLSVSAAASANTFEILNNKVVLIQAGAIGAIEESFGEKK